MTRTAALFLAASILFQGAPSMPHHATGTFDVDIKPSAETHPDTLARMTFSKHLHGDLEGTSQGEMITAGDYKSGSAGYVAMELVTGTLAGRSGTFALQQTATIDAQGQHLLITVTPGSGTGALQGLTGTFKIVIAGGKHSYMFDYTLPA